MTMLRRLQAGGDSGSRAALLVLAVLAVGPATGPASGQDAAWEDGPMPTVPVEAVDPAAQRERIIAERIALLEPACSRALAIDLALLRTLRGDLSPEQRRLVRSAGEAALKASVVEIVDAEIRESEAMGHPAAPPQDGIAIVVEDLFGRIGGLFGWENAPAAPAAAPPPPPPPAPIVDPAARVTVALAAAVEAHVDADTARGFLDEVKSRAERHRVAVVRRVVMRLDEDLRLSAAQRSTLRAAILAAWTDDLAILDAGLGGWQINGRAFYPGLDPGLVVPHLDPIQRRRFVSDEPDGNSHHEEMMRTNLEGMRASAPINRLFRLQEMPRDPWWYE